MALPWRKSRLRARSAEGRRVWTPHTATIYALLNPDTRAPVYVGLTTLSLNLRLNGHRDGRWQRSCERSTIHLWLRELVDGRGRRPLIVALGRYLLEIAGYAELARCRFYQGRGAYLLNADPPEVKLPANMLAAGQPGAGTLRPIAHARH
jgi:hypothetical protein